MYRKTHFTVILMLCCTCLCSRLQAQQDYPAISMEDFGDGVRHWYGIKDRSNFINPVPNQPVYKETQLKEIADNILLFQRDNGGWPKNYDMRAILTPEQKQKLADTKSVLHTTFDNSTTYTHIRYLAKVYNLTHEERYRKGCEDGIRFCLNAQFVNGGWAQYFPLEKGYSRHITYNDGAFLGVLKLMQSIATGEPDFSFIDSCLRAKAETSFRKGLECILNSQILDNGRLTVWCQQHDEQTLKPAWARAFEPPVICNGESADIVAFLMSLNKPDARIIQSVRAAVKWFESSKILYTRVQTVKAPVENSQYRSFATDKVVVTDSTAAPVWTRYYEPITDRPMFSDRNSKYLYSLAEVSRERRVGYAWYVYSPQKVLDNYPAWEKRIARQ